MITRTRQCCLILFLFMISNTTSSSIGDGKKSPGVYSSVKSDITRGIPSNATNTKRGILEDNEFYERSRRTSYGDATGLPIAVLGQQLLSKGFVDLALTGVQFGLCYYVARAIWKAIVEVVEEFEDNSAGLNPDEHDSLLFSEEGVNLATDSLAQQIDSNGGDKERGAPKPGQNEVSGGEKAPRKIIGRQSAYASSLATRLLSSGLPLYHHEEAGKASVKSVRSVLKSLTRTEGRLLENTLLSPSEAVEDLHKSSNDRQRRLVQIWGDIGGLEDVKEGLMDLVFPLMNNNLYTDDGNEINDASNYYVILSNPPGVLLYGPPGCGKTMLVRALAGTANARFLCVTPSTLFRKYVGETNINVKALFTLARKISPCIIFIDEMEGLFRERRSSGNEEHEVNRELKTEFMQLWDGIKAENDGIVVVGATNRPFDVDSAFLRRMPRSFFVGLPDVFARKKILSTMLANVPLDDNFNLDHIAGNTEDYTPSDMKEVLRTAALFPLREARLNVIRRKEEGDNVPQSECVQPRLRPLQTDDVVQALQRVAPTPLPNDYRRALMTFASKASGRAFPPSYLNTNQSPNEGGNTSNNGYYVSDINSGASPQVNGFNMYEESDYDDGEYSYDDNSED